MSAAAVTELKVVGAAERALTAIDAYLERCSLAAQTVKAYRRQCAAYVTWLEVDGGHPDAFDDVVGAKAAVTAWRRHLMHDRRSASTINQALAAVTLMYQHTGLRIDVKRARVPRPGEPAAPTDRQMAAIERAADRRGVRDAAIVAVFRYTGPRVEEAARLDLDDVGITARTGEVRIHGKGDQLRAVPIPAPGRERVTAWLEVRGREPGPLWLGQRGPLSISGLTQVVLAIGADAGVQNLRPHRLRHYYATRLRQQGLDPAQIQALLGHASLDTTARYFRAGRAELAAAVERAFG